MPSVFVGHFQDVVSVLQVVKFQQSARWLEDRVIGDLDNLLVEIPFSRWKGAFERILAPIGIGQKFHHQGGNVTFGVGGVTAPFPFTLPRLHRGDVQPIRCFGDDSIVEGGTQPKVGHHQHFRTNPVRQF